jgi:hypothetical protein
MPLFASEAIDKIQCAVKETLIQSVKFMIEVVQFVPQCFKTASPPRMS